MGKRDDILTAAFDIITEEGLQGLTFSKIFEKAGVGSGTVYNYFSSKEELVCELFNQIQSHMADVLGVRTMPDDTIYAQFCYAIGNLIDYELNYQNELLFLIDFVHFSLLTDKNRCTYANPDMSVLYRMYERGQHEGLIRKMSPLLCSKIVSGIVHYGVTGFLQGQYPFGESDKKDLIEVAWRSLKL